MSFTKSFSASHAQNFNSTENSLNLEEFQLYQSNLLELTFTPPNYASEQIFAGSYINIFFDPHYPQQFKCPDWFGVLGVDKFHKGQQIRTSYVTWKERFNPFIVVEFLSDETATEDLGETPVGGDAVPTKWDVYEQFLRIPYYVVFDAETSQLEAFQMVGSCYQQLEPDQGRIWISDLELGLGLWKGVYQGMERQWLRWYDLRGNWVEVDNNKLSVPHPNFERIKQRKQIDKNQKIGQNLSEKLKKIGVKVDLI